MARLPRKPRLLKYPKKPSASASTATLERYLDRVKATDQTNTDRMRDYQKAVKQYEDDKKRRAALKHRIAGIGRTTDMSKRRASTHRKKKAIGKVKRRTAKRATKKRTTTRRKRR